MSSIKKPVKRKVKPAFHGGIIFDKEHIKKVQARGHIVYYSEYNNNIHFWKEVDGPERYEPIGNIVEINFFLYVKRSIFGQTGFAGNENWYKVVDFFTNPDPDEMEKAKLMFHIHPGVDND